MVWIWTIKKYCGMTTKYHCVHESSFEPIDEWMTELFTFKWSKSNFLSSRECSDFLHNFPQRKLKQNLKFNAYELFNSGFDSIRLFFFSNNFLFSSTYSKPFTLFSQMLKIAQTAQCIRSFCSLYFALYIKIQFRIIIICQLGSSLGGFGSKKKIILFSYSYFVYPKYCVRIAWPDALFYQHFSFFRPTVFITLNLHLEKWLCRILCPSSVQLCFE